ncbi:MAG TPA: hypothetical protein EYO75_08005 [Sulfurimonas sp.]|nr:hypothetical protein [Sulfurimonas sp.]HIM74929.1 hypothetical protein [Campylobacterales bacterium]
MKSKYLFPSIALGLVLFMAVYFLLNPSYEKSIEAKEYLSQMNEIAKHDSISNAERAKMKLMSIITDSELVKEAKKYHDDFEILLEKVTE